MALLGGGMSLGGGIGVGTLVGHVVADVSKWTTGLQRAGMQLKGFSNKMDGFLKRNAVSFRRLGMRAAIVGAAVVVGVGAMVKSYGEFERRMRRATAVSEVSDKQFQEMSKMAEKSSVRLNIAATQAADAFYYLGSAGLTASEQMEAFPAVAILSKAAIIDMDNAAEMIVDTIKAYQKSFKDTTEVTDIFTEAVISSNMTFSHLGETMSLVGAIGRRTNNSIAELTAMIGLMANTGIKGSRAGTSLRRALLNLAAPSSEVRQELIKWGITIYDVEGRMKPFVQIVAEFGEVLKDATEEQKNLAFKTMFGVRAITGQLAIFDLGVDKVRAYVDQLNAAGGASERVAQKQMKAFMEQIGRVGKEIKRLARHIGESLAPAIRNFANWIGPVISDIVEWVDKNRELVVSITATVAAMGTTLLIAGTLTLAVAGLAMAASGLGVSIAALATIIGVTTIGIGALVTVIVYVTTKILRLRKNIRELKKELKFNDNIKRIFKLQQALEKLVEGSGEVNKLIGRLQAIKEAIIELNEKSVQAITATREELIRMLEESGVTLSKIQKTMVITPFLREQVLKMLSNSKEAIVELYEDAAKEAKKFTGKTTEITKSSINNESSLFKAALELRRRQREEEYQDFKRIAGDISKDWSKLDVITVESTVEALDTMQDSMTDFFTETMMDAKKWKDHFINFLKEIQRAMLRVLSRRLSESFFNWITPEPAGGGPSSGPPEVFEAAKGGILPGTFTPLASGGIVSEPTLGLVGERGKEAVIPLSGGRYVPVEMRGGGSTNVEINVINKTSRPVGAERGVTRLDGAKLVTDVILTDIEGYGPIRGAIAGL